jgi:uncharacterized protein YgiM (DUF1202 family)
VTRVLSIIFGITVLALVATGLTEAAMAIGQSQSTSPEPAAKKVVVVTTKPATVIPATAPKVTPTPPATPVTPVEPTATVNGFVHLRASATTSSAIITDLNAGDVVSYNSVDAGLWQAVTYQGTDGYVYKSYLNY